MPGWHRAAYLRDGVVVLRARLSRDVLLPLSAACDHVLSQVRAASPNVGHNSTHIRGLLDPAFYSGRPQLLEGLISFASSSTVVALAEGLGQPLEGELRLRAVEYFHEPSTRDYDGEWHRDGDEVQRPRLTVDDGSAVRPATLLRFRIAFAPDDHLEYVPGSQLRADTPEELHARRGAIRNGPIPSPSVRIALQPGDICLFDTWGIHRGRYRKQSPRRTLDLLFGFGARRSTLIADLRALMATREKH